MNKLKGVDTNQLIRENNSYDFYEKLTEKLVLDLNSYKSISELENSLNFLEKNRLHTKKFDFSFDIDYFLTIANDDYSILLRLLNPDLGLKNFDIDSFYNSLLQLDSNLLFTNIDNNIYIDNLLTLIRNNYGGNEYYNYNDLRKKLLDFTINTGSDNIRFLAKLSDYIKGIELDYYKAFSFEKVFEILNHTSYNRNVIKYPEDLYRNTAKDLNISIINNILDTNLDKPIINRLYKKGALMNSVRYSITTDYKDLPIYQKKHLLQADLILNTTYNGVDFNFNFNKYKLSEDIYNSNSILFKDNSLYFLDLYIAKKYNLEIPATLLNKPKINTKLEFEILRDLKAPKIYNVYSNLYEIIDNKYDRSDFRGSGRDEVFVVLDYLAYFTTSMFIKQHNRDTNLNRSLIDHE